MSVPAKKSRLFRSRRGLSERGRDIEIRYAVRMNAPDLIAALDLREHPEGGWYREVFRSAETIDTERGERSVSTAIYFLLVEGTFSAWHKVKSDEVWHHYAGSAVTLFTLEGGRVRKRLLGGDLPAGQRPQITIPRGVLQAARVAAGWALCGCTVSPGFDFADFEMPERANLLATWPDCAEHIIELTR